MGRPVPGGGGIVPDIQVSRTAQTPFRAVMEASGAFTSFAAEYLRDHKVTDGWEVPPEALDQFQSWLSERQIQPSLHEWISERPYLQSRFKTEVYNLALGVEKGDEVEAQSDQQIQKALEAVLKPPF
jgi:carboxyl-terminal processing protease